MGRRVVPRVLRPSPLARGGGGAGGLMRKLFVVLGDPVAHSRSPAIQARAFALLGVDAAYAPCRVAPQDLEQAVDGLRALGADGFNVTVPHKTEVASLVDRLHGTAARIAAVSCVARDGDALVGHNTDAPGLLRALAARHLDATGRAVVVGARCRRRRWSCIAPPSACRTTLCRSIRRCSRLERRWPSSSIGAAPARPRF